MARGCLHWPFTTIAGSTSVRLSRPKGEGASRASNKEGELNWVGGYQQLLSDAVRQKMGKAKATAP